MGENLKEYKLESFNGQIIQSDLLQNLWLSMILLICEIKI